MLVQVGGNPNLHAQTILKKKRKLLAHIKNNEALTFVLSKINTAKLAAVSDQTKLIDIITP